MSTIDQQAMYWAVRLSDHGLDETQGREFDAWMEADIRHQGAYLRAVAINRALNQATVQESLRPNRERLEAEWAGAPWKQTSSRRGFLVAAGASAGAAFLALAHLVPTADKTVLTTAKGEFRKVPLADKSVADINSGSQLEFRMSQQKRQVMLKKGEVWLEVAKDKTKPFIVEAGQVRVRAVGTAFGVRRFGNGAEVLVTEGTVEVWSNEGTAHKHLVTAGERTFVADGATEIAVTRQPVEVQRKLAWREGKLIFDNQTLSEAVADFNRYSQKKIIIADPSLGARKLVGQYQIDAPELFAQDVGTVLQIPVAVTAEHIEIGTTPSG
jgi:transmembrane sensor